MPKVFVRTQPKSGLKVRHRAGMGFTEIWKETEVDEATRAALEEDPYLEVSEAPTVLVEVAATFQAEAPNTPITTESTAGEDSTQGTDESVQSIAGDASDESSDVDDGAVEVVEVDAVVDDVAVDVVEVAAVVDDQSVVESPEEPAKPAKKAKKAAE